MSFVDGYVLACPETAKDEYVAMASKVSKDPKLTTLPR